MIMKKWFVVSALLLVCSLLPAKVIDANADIGSRKNPVPIGDSYVVDATDIWGTPKSKLAISVYGVVRGEKAATLMQSQNMFNDVPAQGYEYVIPMIMVANLEDLEGEDEPFEVDDTVFEFADAGYSHKKSYDFSYMMVINEPHILDCKLYEGSYTVGLLPYMAPVNDNCYLYFQGIWFELGTVHYLPETEG